MKGLEKPGWSRPRRLSRRASLPFALVVIVAFIVGGAAPAFANPGAPGAPTATPYDGSMLVSFDSSLVPTGGKSISSYTAECDSFDGGLMGRITVGTSDPEPNPFAITVPSLTNGSSYTCTVIATNADGPGPQSPASNVAIPSTKPDPPQAPTLLALNGKIVVSFVPPFDGGTPIIQYSASCTSSDGGVAGSGSSPVPPQPITVQGLTNGKTYTCTVTATNADDNSDPSPPSDSAIPNTNPDTPVAPTATSMPDGTISVDVAPPFDGGSPITGYTAVCASPGDGTLRIGSNPAPPVTVGSVLLGQTYTCTIVATNADGPSGTSQPSSAVIPGAKPDAPQQPTVVAGNATISVGFVPPSDNGSPITGYTAMCTSTNGGIQNSVGGIGWTTSPISVPGLTNGKTYTCTVQAANQFGNAKSPASAAVVPKTVPSRPGMPTVVAGNAQITVSWHAPVNGGFPITQYRVVCTASGGAARAVLAKALSTVVAGLTNGASYRCTVTAYTVVGASPASPPSGIAIPHSHGFRMFNGDGGVFAFGDSPYYGAVRSPTPVIAMMTTPDNHGYWLVANNGAVYAFGNARSYGSLAGHHLNRPIVGGTATRTGHGYWLVASDGGIFSFGDAGYFGSTGNIRLARPIVGMTPTASGRGYWFVAQDGGVFAFGDARTRFYGSAAGRLGPCSSASFGNCVVGMAVSGGGTGYWIAAGNGTVIGFGSAGLSRGAIGGLIYPITGIASTDTGRGYWITAANGAVSVMGDAPYIPWPRSIRLSSYIRGISR